MSPEHRFHHFSPERAEGAKPDVHDLEFVVDERRGQIVKVGDRRDVRAWLEAECAKADEGAAQSFELDHVEGGAVTAGLVDAHAHPVIYGSLGVQKTVFLYGMTGKDQVIDAIRQAAADPERDRDKTIVAIGLDPSKVKGLTADELTAASQGRRVAVADLSFHGGVVSRELAARLEQDAQAARQPFSGYLRTDGTATEQYMLHGLEIADSEYTIEEVIEGTEQVLDHQLRSGVTAIHDMMPLTTEQFITTLHLRRKWREERGIDFPITRFHLDRLQLPAVLERLPELDRLGLIGEEEFRNLVGLKFFADGSLGSYTAKLREPYTGTNESGIYFDTVEQMNEAMEIAARHGIHTVAMHAIGDQAIQRALETARRWHRLADEMRFDPTFRIEHFELPLPLGETLRQTKELGIWTVPQPNFMLDYIYEDRLGERVRWICPHQEILRQKVPMMLGTDGMPLSMLFAIYLATHAEEPHQRLSFQEALLASTLTAAEFEREKRGALREGYQADIIVADPSLIKTLSEGGPDVRNYEQGPSADAKIAEFERQIRRVYKAGVEVYRRAS